MRDKVCRFVDMAMVRVRDEVHAALSARAGVERRSLQATLELLLEKGGLALNGSTLTEPEPGPAQQVGKRRGATAVASAVEPSLVSGSVSVESGGEPVVGRVPSVDGEEPGNSESPPVRRGCWDHRDNPRHWCLACKAEA